MMVSGFHAKATRPEVRCLRIRMESSERKATCLLPALSFAKLESPPQEGAVIRISIEWLEWPGYRAYSFNPITGCSPKSEGCLNCWAKTVSSRFGRSFEITIHLDRFDEPEHWKKPRSVFVCSVSDLFHESLETGVIEQILDIVAKHQENLWFILTKRPERMIEVFKRYEAEEFRETFSNTWFGITAENQTRYLERLPYILQVQSEKRFLSAEPLLGSIELGLMHPFKWVVAGGESGKHCRPMELNWARRLRDDCVLDGIPYYYKQRGGFPDPLHRKKAILDGKLWKQIPIKEGENWQSAESGKC